VVDVNVEGEDREDKLEEGVLKRAEGLLSGTFSSSSSSSDSAASDHGGVRIGLRARAACKSEAVVLEGVTEAEAAAAATAVVALDDEAAAAADVVFDSLVFFFLLPM